MSSSTTTLPRCLYIVTVQRFTGRPMVEQGHDVNECVIIIGLSEIEISKIQEECCRSGSNTNFLLHTETLSLAYVEDVHGVVPSLFCEGKARSGLL